MRSATPTSASCSRQPAKSSWLASSTSRPWLSVPALPWPAAPWHSLTVLGTPKRLPRRDSPLRQRPSPLLQGPAMAPCFRPRPRGSGSRHPACSTLLRPLDPRCQGREPGSRDSASAVGFNQRPVEPRAAIGDPVHLVAAGHADQELRAGADRVDVGKERLLGLGPGSRQDRSRGIGDRARPDEPEAAFHAHAVYRLRHVERDGTWTKTQPIRSPRGNIQPAVVQLAEEDLVAYCRRGGDYKPETKSYIVRSESHDGGLTWSEGKDSEFPNPNAAVDFVKLRSGQLLLVYNHSMDRRTPLTVALSFDLDRTWPVRRNLREGDNDYGYPIAFQGGDGRIHVVFTSDRRTVVNHAVFDEDWVIHGPSQ